MDRNRRHVPNDTDVTCIALLATCTVTPSTGTWLIRFENIRNSRTNYFDINSSSVSGLTSNWIITLTSGRPGMLYGE